MDWRKGFSSRYYITLVDRDTWRDIKRFEITGGSIKRSTSDLRHSADINVKNYNQNGEQLIRVWLDTMQNGVSNHTPLFTGYATTPGRDIDGMLVSNALQCYSVLKAADDMRLPRGWYAPSGISAIWQIKELLKVTKAPVKILGNTSDPAKVQLKKAVVAEQNETYLTMVDLLLATINWRMTLTGLGEIVLDNYQRGTDVVFDSREHDILEPTISDDYDWFNCPNVFRAVMDGDFAEARDEDPYSPLSIQNRGREVWAEEYSCNLNEKETLAEYAKRRLKELQQVSRVVSYDRRFRPDVTATDMIRLNYPAQKIIGNFIVKSQGIDLGFGAKTSEEVVQV